MIKIDMEMPESCEKCNINTIISSGSLKYIYCSMLKTKVGLLKEWAINKNIEKPDNCPLIEVEE